MEMVKKILLTVLSAALITVIVLGVQWMMGPLRLAITQTTTNKQGTFDVSGSSQIITVPDTAEVSLGISEQGSSVKEVQDKANLVLKNISDGLVKLGVKKEDIKTANYYISPNYDISSGRQRINGYTVNASLAVKLKDFEKLNQAIDLATGAGANQVGGVNFTVSDEKMKELKTEARKEAIDDAKKNAVELANLAGMKLGRVVNVSENQGRPPIVQPLAVDVMKSEAAGVPTRIEPGTTTLEYTVTISYETL